MSCGRSRSFAMPLPCKLFQILFANLTRRHPAQPGAVQCCGGLGCKSGRRATGYTAAGAARAGKHLRFLRSRECLLRRRVCSRVPPRLEPARRRPVSTYPSWSTTPRRSTTGMARAGTCESDAEMSISTSIRSPFFRSDAVNGTVAAAARVSARHADSFGSALGRCANIPAG